MIFASTVSAQILPQDSVKIKSSDYNLPQPQINYASLSLISAASITTGGILHNYQYQSWWKIIHQISLLIILLTIINL